MKYLLDVNVLLALGFADHQFHTRIISWIKSELPVELLTCPISELGFVRVLAQVPEYPYSVTEATTLLINLKKNKNLQFCFVPDSNDISSLPAWTKTPKQTTDGYLLQLAKSNGAALATFDRKIPGASYIP
jgi:hypothetical protein